MIQLPSNPSATPSKWEPCDWERLIASARNGHEPALVKILQQVKEYLLAVAAGQLSEGLQGKFGSSDIVQQSMIEACQDFGAFRGDSEAELKSWLKRIVLYNLTDEARRYTHTKSREASREVTADEGDLLSALACPKSRTASWMVSRNEESIRLLHAVAKLPTRQRTVVEARHRWAKSYQQIGAELNITETAARSLWQRAMQNLRAILGEPKLDEPKLGDAKVDNTVPNDTMPKDHDGQLRQQSSAIKP